MTMNGTELREMVRYMYGDGGQLQLAKDLGVNQVTVSRWATGFSPIGATEERLIRLMALLHRKQFPWRSAVAAQAKRVCLEDMI